jgi:hypothetical protein
MKITIAMVMGALLLGSPVLSVACKKGEHEKADASGKGDAKKGQDVKKG